MQSMTYEQLADIYDLNTFERVYIRKYIGKLKEIYEKFQEIKRDRIKRAIQITNIPYGDILTIEDKKNLEYTRDALLGYKERELAKFKKNLKIQTAITSITDTFISGYYMMPQTSVEKDQYDRSEAKKRADIQIIHQKKTEIKREIYENFSIVHLKEPLREIFNKLLKLGDNLKAINDDFKDYRLKMFKKYMDKFVKGELKMINGNAIDEIGKEIGKYLHELIGVFVEKRDILTHAIYKERVSLQEYKGFLMREFADKIAFGLDSDIRDTVVNNLTKGLRELLNDIKIARDMILEFDKRPDKQISVYPDYEIKENALPLSTILTMNIKDYPIIITMGRLMRIIENKSFRELFSDDHPEEIREARKKIRDQISIYIDIWMPVIYSYDTIEGLFRDTTKGIILSFFNRQIAENPMNFARVNFKDGNPDYFLWRKDTNININFLADGIIRNLDRHICNEGLKLKEVTIDCDMKKYRKQIVTVLSTELDSVLYRVPPDRVSQ